jgi:hypothetical protein
MPVVGVCPMGSRGHLNYRVKSARNDVGGVGEWANESISLDPRWAAPHAKVAMVAAPGSPLPAICLLFDGLDVCRHRALSARRD